MTLQDITNMQFKDNEDRIQGSIALERSRIIQKYGAMNLAPRFELRTINKLKLELKQK